MELTVSQHPTGAVRLPIQQGAVCLNEPGLLTLTCSLSELSDSDCACAVSFESLHPDAARSWQLKLSRGRVFSAELAAPLLSPFQLQVEVIDVRPTEQGVALELRFLQIDLVHREALNGALMELAGRKLSHRTQTDIEDVLTGNSGDLYRGMRLGAVLVALGKLTQAQADQAEAAAKKMREPIGRHLVRRCMITQIELCGALSLQSGLQMVDLQGRQITPALTGRFSYLTMLKHQFIPYEETPSGISIAAARPLSSAVVKELQAKSGQSIQVFLGEEESISKLLYALHPDRARRHRKGMRYSLHLPVVFQVGNKRSQQFEAYEFDGTSLNLSEGGLCINTVHDIGMHDALRVRLSFQQRSAEGIYVIRHSQHSVEQQQSLWRLGLELIEADAASTAAIREICIQLGLIGSKRRTKTRIAGTW